MQPIEPTATSENTFNGENVIFMIFDIDGTLTAADTNLAWVAHEGGNPQAFDTHQREMKTGAFDGRRWDMEMAMAHLLREMPNRPDLWADPNVPATMTRAGMEKTGREFTKFHPGVISEAGEKTFFENIQDYVKATYGDKITLEFHAVSGGHRVLAENLAVSRNFKTISASEPHFDQNGKFSEMASVMKEYDKLGCVRRVQKDEGVPFCNMIYLGDGLNDKHAMEEIEQGGGTAIGIEGHHTEMLRQANITHVLPPDYTKQSAIFEAARQAIDIRAQAILEHRNGQDRDRGQSLVPTFTMEVLRGAQFPASRPPVPYQSLPRTGEKGAEKV